MNDVPDEPDRASKPEAESAGPARKKRRPGRFRRWLVRPVAWILFLIVLVPVVLLWGVHRPTVQDRLLQIGLARAEAALGRVVTVESAQFRFLPLSVELENATLGGPKPEAPPVIVVDRLRVEASLFDLLRRRIHVSSIEIDGVDFYLERLEDKTMNLPFSGRRQRDPNAPAAQRDLPDIGLEIGLVELRGGAMIYDDERVRLDLEAQRISLDLLGTLPYRVQGDVTIEHVTVVPPDGRPYSGAVKGRIALGPEGMTIDSVDVATPDGQVRATGSVGWQRPDRIVDLRVVGALTPEAFQKMGYLQSDLRGLVDVDARIQWRPGSWGFRGAVEAERIDAQQWTVEDVVGTVSGDRNAIWIEIHQGSYGAGRIEGSIEIQRDPGQKVGVEVDMRGRRLEAQRLLDDGRVPLDGIASRLSGSVNLRFRGGDWEHAEGWADFVAEEDDLALGIPLAGPLPLVVDGGVVEGRAVRLSSSHGFELVAEATYELRERTGRFTFDLDVENVGPLRVLLPGYDPQLPPPYWLPDRGRGEARVVLDVEPGAARAAVAFDLRDVATSVTTAERASGALEIDGEALQRLRVELERPERALLVTARVPFGEDMAHDWTLGLDAAGWPVEEARPFLPFELPVTGPFTGSASLEGRVEGLEGRVSGFVAPAHLFGTDVRELRAELELEPDRVDATRFELATAMGELSGQGRVRLADGGLDLTVDAPRLDLGELLPGRELEGTASARAHVGGSLESPAVEATLTTSSVSVRGQELVTGADPNLDFGWEDGQVEIEGSLLGLADVQGGGRLDWDGSDVELWCVIDDLEAVGALFTDLPVGGRAEGRLAVGTSGVRVAIEDLDAVFSGHPVHNFETIELAIGPEAVQVDSIYVGGTTLDSELFLTGTIGLAGEGPLDLRAQARLDNRWLVPFLDGVEPTGTTDALGRITGTLASPVVSGQAEVTAPRVVWTSAGMVFDEVSGILLFDPGVLILDTVTARYARGTVRAYGRIGADESGLEGRIQIAGRGVSLPYPEGWRLQGDTDLVWTITGEEQLLRGAATIDRGTYLQDINLSLDQVLSAFFEESREDLAGADQALDLVALNLVVSSPETMRIKNNVADLVASAEITVRGTLARPVLLGEVVAAPGGRLTYADVNYDLERGRLTFANPQRIEPLIDVVANAEVAEYDVSMNLFGTPERLQTTFTSDPPLSDLEVLSLLLSGDATQFNETLRPQTDQTTTSAAEGFLLGQASSALGRRVGSLFGLDAFRIEPLSSSGARLAGARFRAGKRLSSRLYVTYSVDPSAPEEYEVQVEWRVSPGFLILLTQHEESFGVDLARERRW